MGRPLYHSDPFVSHFNLLVRIFGLVEQSTDLSVAIGSEAIVDTQIPVYYPF